MGIWEGLKRGAKALIPDRSPGTFLAGGQKVTCPHCKSDTFLEGRVLYPAFRMTLPHVDWAHEKPATLMCDHCGLIQWFGVEPERLVTSQKRLEGAGDA